jgi:hypothetical protein
MTNHGSTPPFWSTASFADSDEPFADDLQLLGQHLCLCKRPNGRWFAMQCMGQSVNGFVKAHLITSLIAVSMVAGLASLLF